MNICQRVRWCYNKERHGQSVDSFPRPNHHRVQGQTQAVTTNKMLSRQQTISAQPCKKATRLFRHKEIGEYGQVMDFHVNCYLNSSRQFSYTYRQSNSFVKIMLTIPGIKYQLHKSLRMDNAQTPFRQFPHQADDFH